MLNSINSKEFNNILEEIESRKTKTVKVNKKNTVIPSPYPSPEDWRDQWIYFIMTDRFNNPYSNPKGKWDDPDYNDFQGGNFKGITVKLDYLRDLGINAVWITPPFKNCQYLKDTYHGYGIQDFLNIDNRFGKEEDLIELIDQAHARGIYIIFDIILNHAGNVFSYKLDDATIVYETAWGGDKEYDILWHNEKGKAVYPALPSNCSQDAGIFPKELQNNQYFRKKGKGGEPYGDFFSLKELVTSIKEVRNILIKVYQYVIAKYDVDGFRIDTLKYIERDFACTFGNSMREYALSIGKKNFFTFGEVWDNEEKISKFIGRFTGDEQGIIGVDAALDYPLFNNISNVMKGFSPPSTIVNTFENRKRSEENLISSHGEASKYFVTFFDNHDQKERFYYNDGTGKWDDQLILAIGAIFTLQGIPCIYYGTEQGLSGKGENDRAVRQALWGKPNAFNMDHKFYKAISDISKIRNENPALRYGRQYFRQISNDETNFDISKSVRGVLAYSRILFDTEIIIMINTNVNGNWSGNVTVDFDISPDNSVWNIIYSNKDIIKNKISTRTINSRRVVPINLQSNEIQILKKN